MVAGRDANRSRFRELSPLLGISFGNGSEDGSALGSFVEAGSFSGLSLPPGSRNILPSAQLLG